MIKVKDPGNHIIGASGADLDEVGIRGRINADQIEEVYFAHPIIITPGEMDINIEDIRYGGEIKDAGGRGYGAVVRWEKTSSKQSLHQKLNYKCKKGTKDPNKIGRAHV